MSDQPAEFDNPKYRTIANLLAGMRISFYELGLFQEWATAVNNEFAQLLSMRDVDSSEEILARTRTAAEMGRADQVKVSLN